MQSACAVLYCHLWPVWLYHIFPHYLINGTIFIKKRYWTKNLSYVYWTVHHLDSWIKRHQRDVTYLIISLFNAQHISDVNTSILRGLRLICWVISWVVLLWYDVCWCYVLVWLGWCGIRMQAEALVLQPVSVFDNERPRSPFLIQLNPFLNFTPFLCVFIIFVFNR